MMKRKRMKEMTKKFFRVLEMHCKGGLNIEFRWLTSSPIFYLSSRSLKLYNNLSE